MAFRCLFITSSYSKTCLRASKLKPSIFSCADSIALETSFASIGSSSAIPNLPIMFLTRSEPKIRISSSSSETKNRVSPGAPPELIVKAAGLVAFRAQNKKTVRGLDLLALHDVGRVASENYVHASPRDICRQGHSPLSPGLRYDFGLLLVVFGVQNLMRHPFALQDFRKPFVFFNGDSPH